MAELEINFQFRANAQSLKVEPREIQAMGENFARMIVDEVALAASKNSFESARSAFIRGVRTAIMSEVSRMAMLIGRFLPLPDKYTGPSGQMSISDGSGGMSATAELFHFKPSFNRKEANIQWAKRSQKYLAWKSRSQFNTRKWWELTGKLKQDLMSKDASFYEEIFGPIRVRFVRPPPGRDARGRFTAKNNIGTPGVTPASALAGGVAKAGHVNVSMTGAQGRVSSEYRVGTLEIDVFGKITPAMLPALNGKTMNPKLAQPQEGNLGLAALFPNDGPGGTRNKLLGTRNGNHYRYAIEPFVSFFLTRAIPNAVWRRTENIVSGNVSRLEQGNGLNQQWAV